MPPTFSRRAYFANLWKEGLLGKGLGILWAAYTSLLALRDGGLVDVQPSGLLAMIPNISWAWWAAGTAIVFLVWCFEASFRVQRKTLALVHDLEERLASPTRIARERMAGQLADDRLKMLDTLVVATNRVLSHTWEKHLIPLELEGLAARFFSDMNFGQLWNNYCKACLEFWKQYPEEQKGNPSARAGLLDIHYKSYGNNLLIARDALRDYLMDVEPR